MSYESNLVILQAFLKRLEELPEGEEFPIALPPEEITSLRAFLYDHWDRTDQKGVFKIKRTPEGAQLLKRRTLKGAADSLSQLSPILGSPAKARRAFPGLGIEFYAQHGADKTFAEFHPLVMASQEAGDLSELETSRAFDEHQRVHGMPSSGEAAKEDLK